MPFSVLVQGDILNPEYSHSDLIPDAISSNQLFYHFYYQQLLLESKIRE